MKKHFFATFAFLLLVNTSATWAQKAYDKVLYMGKTQNITLLLTFAHGYIEASEIKSTDNKTKKTSKFLPSPKGQAENGDMHFVKYSPKTGQPNKVKKWLHLVT